MGNTKENSGLDVGGMQLLPHQYLGPELDMAYTSDKIHVTFTFFEKKIVSCKNLDKIHGAPSRHHGHEVHFLELF